MRNINLGIKIIYYLLIILWLSDSVFAQNKPIQFNRYTSSNGLSQNKAAAIVQDHDGFIWIGTEDGLNKYDGYNFEIYKRVPGDSLSINDNWVNTLHVAKNGTIWIGGLFGGLSRYNSTTDNFTNFTHDHSDPNSISDINIAYIDEDEKGNLWITTVDNGFDYMMVEEGKFIHMVNMLPPGYPIIKDQIFFVYQDKQNHLWVGTSGKVHYFNIVYNKSGVPQLLPEKIANQEIKSDATTIKEDSDGNIWIGTQSDGLLKFSAKEKALVKIEPKEKKMLFEKLTILAIEYDDKGNLWIGGIPGNNRFTSTEDSSPGLFRFNIESNQIQEILDDPKDEKSLSSNLILSLLVDQTGVLWVGTALSGINVYDDSVIKFSLMKTGPEDSNAIKNPIRGFNVDKNNLLWIATQGGGLVSFDRVNNKYEFFVNDQTIPNSISSNNVFSLYEDNKYLWVGTGQGLNRFDKKTKTFNRYYIDSLDLNNNFNRINYNTLELEKYPGYLWFGTNGSGLVKFGKEKGTMKKYTYDPEDENSLNNRSNFVRTVWYSESRPNELWTGTTNGINILNLNDETFRYYNYDPKDSTSLSHTNVMDFREDEKGYIWVATYGGGLNRLDPKTGKFLRFTQENSDLPNNGVYGMLPDEEGNLWISTNNGITKFNPNSFKFRNYTVDDGLQSEEFNGGSFYKAPDGEMFFGGIKGYNSFYPADVIDNKYKPNLVITDLKIFNESIKVGKDSPLKKQISRTEEIVLSHWQNDISFDYVGLHFANPSKNRYAFKLENYENEWRYVNEQRTATYTNLDPGEYIFQVIGSNNDGLWNEEGTSIKLLILPPWWRTYWAYASYILLIGLSIFAVDRIQRARLVSIEKRKAQFALLEAENKRKSEELEEARQLQLSMLPKNLPNLPHLDIAVYMKTATEVGGDYYDFHIGLDGTLTVVLGDATGHGMKAGTMVTTTKSLFNVLAPNPNIIETFHEMTRCLKLMHMEKLSMCLTMLKIIGNKIQMSSAGMPPVFIYKRESQTIEEHVIKGMPLGTFNNFPYSIVESNIGTGDTILLMSDGFPELLNNDKEMYGYKRARNYFEEIADESPENIIDHLKEEGSKWVNDQEPDDDVTFVVIKVK
jgi:serine phosphatase RsbU (regulator of sigma subunit)/ligand-binding sensor domain-containing protein